MTLPDAYRAFDIGGKVAIVTGGASGIGKGIVRHFADAGAKVVIADADAGRAEALVAEIGMDRALAIGVDVSDPAMVRSLVESTVQACGTVDILVHSAGVIPYKPLLDLTVEEWDRCHAVNLRGTFLVIQAMVAQLRRERKAGAIVTIASLASVRPFRDMPAYASSKGGVMMLTRNAALDCAADDIRINAILPGGVMTEGVRGNYPDLADAERVLSENVPLGRYAMPADIARAAAFLASPAASFITGHGLVVDGGYLLN